MLRSYRLFIGIIFLSFTQSLYSQDEQQSVVHLIGKNSGDKIKLRWAPNSPDNWFKLRDQSYKLYRAEIVDGLPSGNDYRLIESNISPWSYTEFETAYKSGSISDYVTMAGEAIYGDWETMVPDSAELDNWGNKIEELDTKYTVAMFSADIDYGAALASGLAYIDDDIKKGKQYAYKLVCGVDSVIYSEYKLVRTKSPRDIDQIILSPSIEKENQVILNWKRSIHETKYSAYHIERSVDGVNFDRLTDKPYVHLTTTDIDDLPFIQYSDSVQNYQAHYYRVFGIDAFGDFSEASETVKLMGRDRTPPVIPLVDSVMMNEDQTEMTLYWHLKEFSEDLSHINIKKSTVLDGDYLQIAKLDKFLSTYVDENAMVNYIQYYKVCAVDTAGNEACTKGKYGSFEDVIPPELPTGLTGSIDSFGVVNLHWNRGDEPDLFAYNVQFSNGKGRVFAQLNTRPVRDTFFADTINLNTLTEDIFYRVNAMDVRLNTSGFSEILRLVKPDTIPPGPSLIKSFSIRPDTVSLEIVWSSSEDLESLFVYRKEAGKDWVQYHELSNDESSYHDANIMAGQTYQYYLRSVDDAGNFTDSPNILSVTTQKSTVNHEMKLEVERDEISLS